MLHAELKEFSQTPPTLTLRSRESQRAGGREESSQGVIAYS